MNVKAAAATTGQGGSSSRISSRVSTLALMAVTGVVIVAVAFLANQPSPTASGDAGGLTPVTLTGSASGPAPVVGQPAPDFAARTVDGKPFQLSALKGRPVWLTFGATWCQPCRAENPDIQAMYDKHRGGGLQVVQVYMSEDAATVNDYTNRVGLTYQRVPDPDERLANEYRILGIPTHYFIDSNGILRKLRIGSLDPAGMEQAVKEIGG